MNPQVARRAVALLAAAVPPTAVHVAWVLPRIRAWGATVQELGRTWPGDELVPEPGFVWTNAITVDRPAAEVWPWVTQLGQGRGGLYSYDWLENAVLADVHSLDRVAPELQGPLAVGDRVVRMTRYAPPNPVAAYVPGRALVLGGIADSAYRLAAGRPSSTWAFIVEPSGPDRCRLVVRSRSGGPVALLQGPVQLVMQRRMMTGIKQRAEGIRAPGTADVLVPLSWFAGLGATAVHARRALRGPRTTRDACAAGLTAGLAAVGVQVLLFWDLPPSARATLTATLVASPLAALPRRIAPRTPGTHSHQR